MWLGGITRLHYVAIKAHKQGAKQTSWKCQRNIISPCLSAVITYGKKQKINTTPRVKSYDRCSETCQIKKGCMLVLGSSLCMCGLMCVPVWACALTRRLFWNKISGDKPLMGVGVWPLDSLIYLAILDGSDEMTTKIKPQARTWGIPNSFLTR